MVPEKLLAQARATLVALRGPVRGMAAAASYRPIDDLMLFARVPRWTARDLATYRDDNPSARLIRGNRDDLQRLQRHGVIGRIQGARTGGGGSAEQVYFRTRLGALVLDLAAGDAPGTLPTRRWVLDAGRVGADGLVTHREAAFVDPHELAIYELARHCGLADAGGWQLERRLPYAIPYHRGTTQVIPDLAWAGANGWCCLEVEGTHQSEHIQQKHAKYDALGQLLAQLDPPQILYVGVIFVDTAHRRRLQLLHENAYAAGGGWYGCGWLDLPALLARHQSPAFWRAMAVADYQALRQRQRDYLDAQRGRYSDEK